MAVVLLQIILLWSIVIITYKFALNRDKIAPVDDIGVFWLSVLILYTTLPPLFWLLQGGEYISVLSGRLLKLQPSVAEVMQLLNIALGYAIGFTIIYIPLCKKIHPRIPTKGTYINRSKLYAALLIIISTKLVIFFVGLFGGIASADSYIDQYRVLLEAPVGIRQVLKMLIGFNSFSIMVILVALLQRWPRYKFLLFLFLAYVLLTFDPSGGRAALATSLFSIAVLWHIVVKPITSKVWLMSSLFGIVVFLILGVIRGVTSLGEYDLFGQDNPGVGEFDALWANAVELLQYKNQGSLSVPFEVRFGELWEFIPSQLLPFEKKSLSIWYVETFYPEYKDAGGGWAFGALSQAVIGGGIVEALLKGALLGLICSVLLKWFRSKKALWVKVPMYVQIMTFSFMSVRDTSLQPVSVFLQTIVPCFFLLMILDYCISGKGVAIEK